MADVAIHLYDMSDVGFAKLYKQNPPSPDRLPTGAVGAYATSTAAQIVGAIRKVADGDRIKVMRIVAHGNSGTFYFPHLRNYDSCSQTYGDIPKDKLWAPLRNQRAAAGSRSRQRQPRRHHSGDLHRRCRRLWALAAEAHRLAVQCADDGSGQRAGRRHVWLGL
jgi:hypothetical protein